MSYLYNYAEAPWKTQERVNTIMTEFYNDTPDGLCGNEDCGQMSAWYIFSTHGFYPVNPANSVYVIGTPRVEEATINLENGKKIKISARNLKPGNIYIRSVILNGK